VETSVGIDLASQNKKTAVCVIEWSGSAARAQRPRIGVDQPCDDTVWLVEAARAATYVGIDAPFGWPDPLVEAVSAWHADEGWPEAEPDDLRFRATDKRVIEVTGMRPLSVSSDRIAVVAWRCARILNELRSEDRSIDRAGGGSVYEVYPAAALRCWGLMTTGYKNRGGVARRRDQQEARESLLSQLQRSAAWLDLSDAWGASVESDDALDALIAALVARAAAQRLTIGPSQEGLDLARREGWIHLPREKSLERLVARM
jgi:predicted nuclease with RNAse H fold